MIAVVVANKVVAKTIKILKDTIFDLLLLSLSQSSSRSAALCPGDNLLKEDSSTLNICCITNDKMSREKAFLLIACLHIKYHTIKNPNHFSSFPKTS